MTIALVYVGGMLVGVMAAAMYYRNHIKNLRKQLHILETTQREAQRDRYKKLREIYAVRDRLREEARKR